jgi:hypothetical protein
MTSPLNRFFERVAQLETEFGNVENPLWEDVRELPYAERSRVAREIALSETMPAFEGRSGPSDSSRDAAASRDGCSAVY